MTANGPVQFDEASHTYSLRGVAIPGVSAVLQLAGMQPSFRGVDPWRLEAAVTLGQRVHEATAIDDAWRLGLSPTGLDLDHEDNADIRPYVNAWRCFRKEQPCEFLPDGIEQLVCCDGDLPYAGRLDRRVRLDGDVTILDLKTGKVLGPTMGLQLAAYLLAVPGAAQRAIVHLKPDGTYTLLTDRQHTAAARAVFVPQDFEDWRACLRIAHRKLRARGAPLPAEHEVEVA